MNWTAMGQMTLIILAALAYARIGIWALDRWGEKGIAVAVGALFVGAIFLAGLLT